MNDTNALPLLSTAALGVLLGMLMMSSKGSSSGPTRPAGSSTPASSSARPYIVAGNWKCNPSTLEEARSLISTLNGAGPIPSHTTVIVSVPFMYIPLALETLRSDVHVAAQNVGENAKCGAFTGEVFAGQLKDMGLEWVIIGHSERRAAGESNDQSAKKASVAIANGLKVMFAVGESDADRTAGNTMKVVADQLLPFKKLLSPSDWSKVVIAYEPVWAIGTGKTATPELAQETHADIRAWVAKNIGEDVARNIVIQYGGSMKGSNAKDLLKCNDIDGGLIGGASLTADFWNVVSAAPR
jgi:triosephosphate isomerase